jgi:cyclase
MDADGTTSGFDLEMIAAVRAAVDVPLIASGGAGRVEDFPPAVSAGADAVLAATVFHYGTLRIADVKAAIAAAGFPVRGPLAPAPVPAVPILAAPVPAAPARVGS